MSFSLASQLDTAALFCLKCSTVIQQETEIQNEKFQLKFDKIINNRK